MFEISSHLLKLEQTPFDHCAPLPSPPTIQPFSGFGYNIANCIRAWFLLSRGMVPENNWHRPRPLRILSGMGVPYLGTIDVYPTSAVSQPLSHFAFSSIPAVSLRHRYLRLRIISISQQPERPSPAIKRQSVDLGSASRVYQSSIQNLGWVRAREPPFMQWMVGLGAPCKLSRWLASQWLDVCAVSINCLVSMVLCHFHVCVTRS